MRSRWLGLCVLPVCLALGACKREPDRSRTYSGANLTVVVKLEAGHPLPTYGSASSSRPLLFDQGPQAPQATCRPDRASQALELAVDRRLSGVVVAAAGFSTHAPRKPKRHEVELRHCQLQPALTVARRGDTLRVVNRDPTAYSLTFGPSARVSPIQPGEERVLGLLEAGVESLMCAPAAPCGRSDVLTLNHSVAAITDTLGEAQLAHFPAGEKVLVGAWHPLLQAATTHVWLSPGQSQHVELHLRPRRLAGTPDDSETIFLP